MNVVQMIHKHVMLRFCVVLLCCFIFVSTFCTSVACGASSGLDNIKSIINSAIEGGFSGAYTGAVTTKTLPGTVLGAISGAGLGAVTEIGSQFADAITGSDGTGSDSDTYTKWVKDNDLDYILDFNNHYVYRASLVQVESLSNAPYDHVQNYFSLSNFTPPVSDYYSVYCIPFDESLSCAGFKGFSFRDANDGGTYSNSARGCDLLSSNIYNFSCYYDFYLDSSHNSYNEKDCLKASNTPHASVYLKSDSTITNSKNISSSRFASISTVINNYNSGTQGYYVADSDGTHDCEHVYDLGLVNETDMTVINVETGEFEKIADVSYDYLTRSYYMTTEKNNNIIVTYGCEYMIVNVNGHEYKYYYYDVNNSSGSTTDPSNPDTPSGGDDDDNSSIWDKVVDAIAGLFTAIGKVIGGLLESVINLFTGIVDGLTGCLDLFGSFGEFVAGFYTWMPEEWRTILAAAFTIFIGLAVVKLFRGS